MNNCNGCNNDLEKYILDNPCKGYSPRSCMSCGNCITDTKSSICFERGDYLSDLALEDNRYCKTWVEYTHKEGTGK